MKKLIAVTAMAGLLAVGCASKENRGGSYDQSNPSYGTGTSSSTGTMNNTTPNSSSTSNAGGNLNNSSGQSGSSTAGGWVGPLLPAAEVEPAEQAISRPVPRLPIPVARPPATAAPARAISLAQAAQTLPSPKYFQSLGGQRQTLLKVCKGDNT